jgi:hypothetical protein
MADGGSLIPNVPVSAAPIHVQMGGVNTPANDTSSVIADAGNNDRSTTNFEKNNTRSMKGQYENDRTLEEFEPNAVDVINNEVAAGPEKSTKKSTIGDDVVIDKLRAILSADKEYQTVLALLGEADPSKLRSNILFNPEYKVIADLLKQIVRFKVEQYAKGLEEVRGEGKSKDVAPAAAVGKVEAEEKPEAVAGEVADAKAGEGSKEKNIEGKTKVESEVQTQDVPQENLLGLSNPPEPIIQSNPQTSEELQGLFPATGSETTAATGSETTTAPGNAPTTETVAEVNPFNQFGPSTNTTTAAVPTPVQANPLPAQTTGGVKSRKASRVLRKLKTMKKSKKHTVPLL